jgi:dTMP kinase
MKIISGKFIVFEGIDGSGKSTLAGLLYDHFVSSNYPAVKGYEPTEGRWGKEIRKLLRNENPPPIKEQMRLFLLDREEDAQKNIIPSLKKGINVILDRYFYSNAAYQGAMGLRPWDIIEENVRRGFPVPDRIYLVDLDPETALKRIIKSNRDGTDSFEKNNFLKRVREIYLSISDERFLKLDGSKEPHELLEIIKEDLLKTVK